MPTSDGQGGGGGGGKPKPKPGITAAQRQAFYDTYQYYPDPGNAYDMDLLHKMGRQSGGGGSGGDSGGSTSSAENGQSSSHDLMSLIHQAGFTGSGADIMYGIVMAESGGNARAHNTNANTGDNSYGLAQINMLGSMGPARLQQYGLSSYNDLFDPLTNLRVAYQMSGHGTHFGDWSTYNSGAYQKYAGQSGATVNYSGTTGGGGGGLTNNGGGGSGSGGQMSAADYSGVDGLGRLLQTVPDLKNIINQAVSGNWSIAKFQNAIQNTQWFKTHSDTVRAALTQQANDPAAWKQQVGNLTGSIQDLAQKLGFQVDGKTLQSIANSAILTGHQNDQQWLTHQLSHNFDPDNVNAKTLGGFSGDMATNIQALQKISSDYGFKYTPQQLADNAQAIANGVYTVDTYKQRLMTWAASAFPSLAKEIQSGTTVRDLAAPYVQSMSNLLEVDPGTLDTFTPAIRKALQGVADPKTGQRATVPLWQFEDQVRTDPRWQYTQNAKDTASTALVKLGSDFGFGPNG